MVLIFTIGLHNTLHHCRPHINTGTKVLAKYHLVIRKSDTFVPELNPAPKAKFKEFGPTTWSIKNKTSIYLVILFVSLAGIYQFVTLPKEQFPDIIIPTIFVQTVYVGNSPKDIENLVTVPIEKQIKGITGAKITKFSSNSQQDFSAITIEFGTNVPTDVALQKVKDAVDKAKSDLPNDLTQAPRVIEISLSEQPIMYVNISGDFDLKKLKEYADVLKDRIEALHLLGYEEDSVGRLMTPDFIAVKIDWTVNRVLSHIRRYGKNSETIDVVYVIDKDGVLLDDIRIREILLADPDIKIGDLTDNRLISLNVNDPQEEAINVFRMNNRVALPVVDDGNILLGIVTVDDILWIAHEEYSEDIQKMGGTQALDEPYLDVPVFQLYNKYHRLLGLHLT